MKDRDSSAEEGAQCGHRATDGKPTKRAEPKHSSDRGVNDASDSTAGGPAPGTDLEERHGSLPIANSDAGDSMSEGDTPGIDATGYTAKLKRPDPTSAPTMSRRRALPMCWAVIGESVVGMSHRRTSPPIGCQDANHATTTPRTIVVVCDGAGSSNVSEVGARELSRGIVRLCSAMDWAVARLLDAPAPGEGFSADDLAIAIHRYAVQLIVDLSAEHKREARDFRTTLLLMLTGVSQTFWLRVGDGEIVGELDGALTRIGEPTKGEYANETVFVDERLPFSSVIHGLVRSDVLTGFAVMSDGAAERLVSGGGTSVARRLSKYIADLRVGALTRDKLFLFLNDYEAWKGTTHDDKTLVVAAR